MKKLFYIRHAKSDKNYDTNEGKFFGSNWEPVYDEKEYLQGLIDNDPEKFEGCEIMEVEASE